MIRLATVPHLGIRTLRAPVATSAAVPAERVHRAATANVRIRRFESDSVNEDSYTAILPSEGATPAELLRVISEAFEELPEFQARGADDEQFILTLTLKG